MGATRSCDFEEFNELVLRGRQHGSETIPAESGVDLPHESSWESTFVDDRRIPDGRFSRLTGRRYRASGIESAKTAMGRPAILGQEVCVMCVRSGIQAGLGGLVTPEG